IFILSTATHAAILNLVVRAYASVVALLFPLVYPFLAPAFVSAAVTMACCRTHTSCCCHKSAAAGPAITVKACPCAAQRSTVPLTRDASVLQAERAACTAFWTAPLAPGESRSRRNAHVWSEFQRPPPPLSVA